MPWMHKVQCHRMSYMHMRKQLTKILELSKSVLLGLADHLLIMS